MSITRVYSDEVREMELGLNLSSYTTTCHINFLYNEPVLEGVAFFQKSIHLDHGCANHDTEGKRFKSPIHCCDVTKPPYLFSGELCTSPLHCKLLFVYTLCCRRTGQCFSVLRTRKSDVVDGSSGRRYVTDQ